MSIVALQTKQTTFAGDESIALTIRYKTSATGTASIDTGTPDLIFTDTGVVASTASLPTSNAATAGTVEMDDASADTLGETLDLINDSTNFEARISAGIRASTVGNTTDEFVDNTVSGTLNPGDVVEVVWNNGNVVDDVNRINWLCIGPEEDSSLEWDARLSAERFPGRKEPSANEGTVAAPFAIPSDQALRGNFASRIFRILHEAADDGVTTAGVLMSSITVFDADQTTEFEIWNSPDTLQGEDSELIEKDFGANPLIANNGRRLVVRHTADPGLATSQINSQTVTVNGGFGPSGGKNLP